MWLVPQCQVISIDFIRLDLLSDTAKVNEMRLPQRLVAGFLAEILVSNLVACNLGSRS